ncbi:MAG: GNAT family N-acetyltransferase [Defluviitaleaceae bacterium]|nr:GNAT family N-acetyltransferase [Defluviitaleaceae bacterium]
MLRSDERELRAGFLPIVIDLWCGDKFNAENRQHTEWLDKKIHVTFENFSVALCAYTDEGEPIGFIWYRHDTGMEGVSFSGKDAHIIQIGLYDRFQRQGIGTQLLDEACRMVKEAGGECLYTDTYAGSRDAMAFYVKSNFIPIACQPGENGLNDLGQVYLYRLL